MFPKSFDYVVPQSLGEALALMVRHGDEAKVLAGGQSLIPLMKLRFLFPSHVIDIGRIPELHGIDERNGEIRCGAMTRHADIERSSLLCKHIPLLYAAATEIADVQVRNRGTLGGALAQADPASDWATTSLALKARFRCVSLRGERMINAGDFFKDTYTTALEDGEILTDIFFPLPHPASRAAYIKIHRRTGDFAIASVALQFTVDGAGHCQTIGLGVGGVGATPVAPADVIAFLQGKTLSDPVIEEAASMLKARLHPIEDIRGSSDYKRRIAGVAFQRAFRKAAGRDRRET